MNEEASTYPASISIDFPEAVNKLTTFFRIFTVIPIAIILAVIGGGNYRGYGFGGSGLLFLPVLLMILFRQKYPRWWYDWNLAFTKFSYRVTAYLLLLRHEYPSTDEEQSVHVELTYPDAANDLNRWLPLVKWLLAIPHYLILFFLDVAVFFVSIYAWFYILFTGKYPRGVFDFVVGVTRWNLRVSAYAFLLLTDQYPPFSLEA
ncbi:MAG: DUF4389 domain-containing protein [Thermoleophilia bacterium]